MCNEALLTIRQLVEVGVTSILVTHEIAFAREIANHVYYADHRVIVDDGVPKEIFGNPRKVRTRAFLKRVFVVIRGGASQRSLPILSRTAAYQNMIPLADQPQFPGNLKLEQRVSAIDHWNALTMVVRAKRAFPKLGGHIASYASSAALFEFGFHYFFRAGQRGDLAYLQPHSVTGVYAREFLEGQLDEEHLAHYRRETADRGILDSSEHRGRKVWLFVGDGEMDEPESSAGRERERNAAELDRAMFRGPARALCRCERIRARGRANICSNAVGALRDKAPDRP